MNMWHNIPMPQKKILFDAGPLLDTKKSGVGYYVQSMVVSLQEYYSSDIELSGYYFNFLNRRKVDVSDFKNLNFQKVSLVPGKIISLARRFGFQPFLELFVRSKADIVIFTNYVSLPQIRKRKTALIIYDLSFLDTPDFTQQRNLKFLRKFCPPSIKRADVIITISQFTKDRIMHYFPNLKAEIIVTPIPPYKLDSSSKPIEHRLKDLGIKKDKYILYLGTIEPRKNLENLIKSWSMINKDLSSYSLVIAGGKGWKDEKIFNELNKQRSSGINIITTGYISENEKSSLYANAVCFVMPSHYEGFGMPILEAMQYNLAVILSDISVFHEVAGNAAEYFNKDDPEDIATKIKAVVQDNNLRSELIKNSKEQLIKFSWEKNAQIIYESLMA